MAVVVTLMAATESDQPSGSREFTTASLTLFTLRFFMCFEMSSQIACQSESLLAHFTFMRTIACNVKKNHLLILVFLFFSTSTWFNYVQFLIRQTCFVMIYSLKMIKFLLAKQVNRNQLVFNAWWLLRLQWVKNGCCES